MPGPLDFLKRLLSSAISKSAIPGGQLLDKKTRQAALRASELPSNILGGVIKAGGQDVRGQFQAPKTGKTLFGLDLGKLLLPGLVGAGRGIKERSTVQQELPKALGVEPETIKGRALGFAGEVATPDPTDVLAALRLGKPVAKVAGKKAKALGEELLESGLRITDSQRTKFFKKNKISVGQFISKNKLTGNVADETIGQIKKLQDQFDDIAVKSNATVTPHQLRTGIKKFIDTLDEVGNKKQIVAIKRLERDLLNQIGKRGFGINVAELTQTRRALDDLIPDSQFARQAAGEPVTNNIFLRNALNSVIRNSTSGIKAGGKTLKEIGQKLSPLFDLEKLASKTQVPGVGKGRLGGLLDLLSLGGGGVAGGVPGAVAALAGRRALTSPQAQQAAGGALIKGAEGIQNPVLRAILGVVGRVGKEAVVQTGEEVLKQEIPQLQQGQTPGATQVQADGQVPVEGQAIEAGGRDVLTPDRETSVRQQLLAVAQTPEGQQLLGGQQIQGKAIGGTGEIELTPQQVAQAHLELSSKEAAKIQKAFDTQQDAILFEQKQQITKAKLAGGGTLTGMERKEKRLAQSGVRALDQLEQILLDDPSAFIQASLPGQLGTVARKYDSAAFRAVEGLLRARSGAAVPETEVRRYMKANLPKFPGDTDESAKFKLESFRLDLEAIANLGESGFEQGSGNQALEDIVGLLGESGLDLSNL